MTTRQIEVYLASVDERIEASVRKRVPFAWLCGYRTDTTTGARVPQFFAGSPSARAELVALGLELAPLGLAMAARTKRAA